MEAASGERVAGYLKLVVIAVESTALTPSRPTSRRGSPIALLGASHSSCLAVLPTQLYSRYIYLV